MRARTVPAISFFLLLSAVAIDICLYCTTNTSIVEAVSAVTAGFTALAERARGLRIERGMGTMQKNAAERKGGASMHWYALGSPYGRG